MANNRRAGGDIPPLVERPSELGSIYTIVEAAAKLRISRRALQELVKAYPFYALNGNRKLFRDEDLLAIWKCMKTGVPFRIRSEPPPSFVLPVAGDDYASLRALLRKQRAEKLAKRLPRPNR
jgi:hypothetical protein